MERRFAVRFAELMQECEVGAKTFEGMAERLEKFMLPFAECLWNSDQSGHAQMYVSGLASNLERKNTESIAYHFDRDRQALQRFIGVVQWDYKPMLMELTRQVGTELGEPDGVIVFDPSAFSKKGTESVGVQRQWNGRLGKVDNCQVGIYLGYVTRREQALVDMRLYLPKERAKDKKHRTKCSIPKQVRFATRHELALQMLKEKGHLLPHAWIAGDDEMGRSTQFRRDLRERQERYLLAVPSNTRVRDLEAEPPPYGGRGARPKSPFVRVDQWRTALPDDAWTRIDVRDAEKGPLVVHVTKRRVLAITERKHPEREETLVVIGTPDGAGNMKYDYYLSNAPPETPLEEFARVAKAEHRIEECFQRAKGEVGLADYETRTWWGWHHHQTLSILAAWFLVEETRRAKKKDAGDHRSAGPPRHGPDPSPGCRAEQHEPHRPRLQAPLTAQRAGSLLPSQKTTTPCALAG